MKLDEKEIGIAGAEILSLTEFKLNFTFSKKLYKYSNFENIKKECINKVELEIFSHEAFDSLKDYIIYSEVSLDKAKEEYSMFDLELHSKIINPPEEKIVDGGRRYDIEDLLGKNEDFNDLHPEKDKKYYKLYTSGSIVFARYLKIMYL